MNKSILNLGKTCTACMACFNICPQDAIAMKEDPEGFLFPAIDEQKCNDCGLCDQRCPELNKPTANAEESLVQHGYYGWHNNDEVRKLSSSGGVFSALAETVLADDGVIFGAIYDVESNIVKHTNSTSDDWTKMRKSKYVQSYIGDAFKQAKNFLIQGKFVLFVGSPCQIAGLKSYLNKTYDRLITCDFICHGVPPMKLLHDHLQMIAEKLHSKVEAFNFRPKTEGWTKHFFDASLISGKMYHMPVQFDPYFGSFSKGFIQRMSCYTCQYKLRQHAADITLADYWGFRRHDPSILDERGLSLIMANTVKGDHFLHSISKTKLTLNNVKWENAAYDYTKRTCVNLSKREAFYKEYKEKGYPHVIKKFKLKGSIKDKFLYYIYRPYFSPFVKFIKAL